MNWGWEPGNDKQGFVVCISVSRNNGEITRKEMSAFFFKISLPLWYGKMSLNKWILGFQQEKIMDFEYCEEYLRSN